MLAWLEQDRTKQVLCLAACLAACAAALCSLSWRMVNDTPNMLYQANLMVKHGLMPYRDFFCINLPGSLWMYGGLVRTLGVSDRSVHAANLLIVVLVSAVTFSAMSPRSRLGAVLGVALAGLRIFSGEVAFILERELLALIPLSCLMLLCLRPPTRGLARGAVAGFLAAWMFLIKPQFVLYGLPAVVVILMEAENRRGLIRLALILGTFFILPIMACGFWIAGKGAWLQFCETVEYWTLYGQMTHSFSFVTPYERVCYVARHVLRMIGSPYLLAAGLALYVAWREQVLERNALVFWWFLLGMTVVVPTSSGQFWGYHRLPFFYFTLCAAGYVLSGRAWWSGGLALLLVVFWVPFTGLRVYRETTVPSVLRLTHGIADVFEKQLKENLRAGDRVQPIDWTSGAVQGMLLADALPATRFIESYYFLHSVSHPLIKKLRNEFLDALSKRPPRFILEATTVTWPSGLDTEKQFLAFEAWREAHYVISKEGEHYRIWEYGR